MKTLFNINDIHAGVVRSGGTTPFTSFEIRRHVIKELRNLLAMVDGDLIVNGDLFDTNSVPFYDLWEVIVCFSDWFKTNNVSDKAQCPVLYLPRGNHDAHKNAGIMSSFDLFCKIISDMFPGQVVTITEPYYIAEHMSWVIPHLQNQDQFNAALERVTEAYYLFVHVNYDNKFAAKSDHSLNMSWEQAVSAPFKHIIFGHEHQQKKAIEGKVVIVGNQIPTSVADCLGNDTKRMLRIEGKTMEFIEVWQAKGDFEEQDWRSLSDYGPRFIRVTGTAHNEEAGEVVATISRFRSKAKKAWVITNSVKVEGVNDQAELELNADDIKAFDVKAALLELLDDDEKAVLARLEGMASAHKLNPALEAFFLAKVTANV